MQIAWELHFWFFFILCILHIILNITILAYKHVTQTIRRLCMLGLNRSEPSTQVFGLSNIVYHNDLSSPTESIQSTSLPWYFPKGVKNGEVIRDAWLHLTTFFFKIGNLTQQHWLVWPALNLVSVFSKTYNY